MIVDLYIIPSNLSCIKYLFTTTLTIRRPLFIRFFVRNIYLTVDRRAISGYCCFFCFESCKNSLRLIVKLLMTNYLKSHLKSTFYIIHINHPFILSLHPSTWRTSESTSDEVIGSLRNINCAYF